MEMEDRSSHGSILGMENDQLKAERASESFPAVNKDLRTNFWKTARDPLAPWVALWSEPFGRLGALVFQPDATETSYWANASLGIETRIAGSAAAVKSVLTRGRKNVFQHRWQVSGSSAETKASSPQPIQMSFPLWRKVENYQQRRQAGARPAWLRLLNFGNDGAQVALPQSLILRSCTTNIPKNTKKENENIIDA